MIYETIKNYKLCTKYEEWMHRICILLYRIEFVSFYHKTLVMIVDTVQVLYHFISSDSFRLYSCPALSFCAIQITSTCTFPYCFSTWLIILTEFIAIEPKLLMPFVWHFDSSIFGIFWKGRSVREKENKARKEIYL